MVQNLSRCARQLCQSLHYELTIDSLTLYLEAAGWQIKDYDISLFKLLRCSMSAKHTSSFIYYTDDLQIVFLRRKQLSTEAMKLTLLHEICHIELGHHLVKNGCDHNDLAEHEAEALAVEVKRIITGRPLRQQITFCLLAALLIAAIGFSASSAPQQRAIFQSEATADTIEKPASGYYITASGKSYHIENCYHIRNRNTMMLTKADAEYMGYTPCKDCLGK